MLFVHRVVGASFLLTIICTVLSIVVVVVVGLPAQRGSNGDVDLQSNSQIANNSHYDQNAAFKKWLNTTMYNYDNRLRPFFGGKPLKIKLGLILISISSLSEASMEFTVEMFFHETWRDERLTFNPEDFGGRTTLTLPFDAPKMVWLPDTSFLNALRSQSPEQGSVSHLSYIKLDANGTVFYSRRLSVTAQCDMDFVMYPFDQQACTLELSSYGSSIEDITYVWAKVEHADPKKKLQLPDFTADDFITNVIQRPYAAGNFSVPRFCIILTRRPGFCYLQLFIPATAVVGSSWISLWLENDTQFSDLMSVILSIIFLSYSANSSLKVSYVKAMDIYLAACFIFAFLSLVKLAIVKRMNNKIRKKKQAKQSMATVFQMPASIMMPISAELSTGQSPLTVNSHLLGQESLQENSPNQNSASSGMKQLLAPIVAAAGNSHDDHDRYWRMMKVVHVGSQLVFPLAFGAFGIFYFFIYPHMHANRGVCHY